MKNKRLIQSRVQFDMDWNFFYNCKCVRRI